MASDDFHQDPPASARPHASWRLPKLTIALSAFMMSLSIALINAFYALRGSEIVVLEPEQVLLYRDGQPPHAVLAFGLPLKLINAAGAGQGDVLLKATIASGDGAPSFAAQGEITPILSDVPDASQRCRLETRCVTLPGLLIQEQSSDIADLPGGTAKALTLTFPAAGWNCTAPNGCDRYADFDRAVAALNGDLTLTGTLQFYGDGRRRFRCRLGPINRAYLTKIGWISMKCRSASVTDSRWL